MIPAQPDGVFHYATAVHHELICLAFHSPVIVSLTRLLGGQRRPGEDLRHRALPRALGRVRRPKLGLVFHFDQFLLFVQHIFGIIINRAMLAALNRPLQLADRHRAPTVRKKYKRFIPAYLAHHAERGAEL